MSQNISFFTPIVYGYQEKTLKEFAVEKADQYFSLGGRQAHVITGQVNASGEKGFVFVTGNSSLFVTALKIISYFSIVIPALMFVIKAVFKDGRPFYEMKQESVLAILKNRNENYDSTQNNPFEDLGRLDDLENKYRPSWQTKTELGLILKVRLEPQWYHLLDYFPLSQGTIQDIKDLVRLKPKTLNQIGSELRTDPLHPLGAALINPWKVPLHVIEFLIESGAVPNPVVQIDNGREIRSFDDLRYSVGRRVSKGRLKDVAKILDKHRYQSEAEALRRLCRS